MLNSCLTESHTPLWHVKFMRKVVVDLFVNQCKISIVSSAHLLLSGPFLTADFQMWSCILSSSPAFISLFIHCICSTFVFSRAWQTSSGRNWWLSQMRMHVQVDAFEFCICFLHLEHVLTECTAVSKESNIRRSVQNTYLLCGVEACWTCCTVTGWEPCTWRKLYICSVFWRRQLMPDNFLENGSPDFTDTKKNNTDCYETKSFLGKGNIQEKGIYPSAHRKTDSGFWHLIIFELNTSNWNCFVVDGW